MSAESYYRGARAEKYDAERSHKPQWQREWNVLEALVRKLNLPDNALVLDVPIGTGRFIALYAAAGRHVIGVDVSSDMLAQAEAQSRLAVDCIIELREGRIDSLKISDRSVDLALCIRLLNLVDFSMFERAISELSRVTRGWVIAGIRVQTPPHRRGHGFQARSMHLVRWVWRLLRNKRPAGRTHPHDEKRVTSELARSGLDVVERSLIEEHPDGSRYYFYLLRASGAM